MAKSRNAPSPAPPPGPAPADTAASGRAATGRAATGPAGAGPASPASADPGPAGGTPAGRSRTVLVSFLGSVVRKMGSWMPIAGTVALLAETGLDSASVRTAVFRLKKRGWLVPQARAGMRGYALTPGALEALAEGDEVIWHAREPADLADGWCFVNFSVPESARALRHQLTAHLTALGFGNIGSAVWIAPARMLPAARRAITELDLTRYCAVFVGDYVAGQDLGTMILGGWDLDGIDGRYREFVTRYGAEADRLAACGVIEGRDAFVTYLSVLDHWRKLPFRDPGLPREVLAEDWSGPAAVRLFERLVSLLEGRALAHAAPHWSAPARSAPDAPVPDRPVATASAPLPRRR